MALNKLLLVLITIIFLCNFVMYFVVKIDGESLILTIAITMTEVLALIFTLWYWRQASPLPARAGRGRNQIF